MSLTKKVFSATIIITIAGGLARLFSIISAPILTYLLGPTPYGIAALVGTFTTLASTIGLHGVDMSYARYYLTRSSLSNDNVERFCWRYVFMSSWIFSLLAALYWGFFIETNTTGHLIALIVGIGTLSYILNTMSLTRSRLNEKYNKIAITIVVSGALSTLVTLGLAYWWRQDEWPLLIGSTFGILVNICILGIPKIESLYKKSELNLHEKWKILQLGLTGSVTAPMYWILTSSDRWFINLFMGKETVGIYSFANNMAYIGHLVTNAILYAWFPESIKAYEEKGEDACEILSRVWEQLTLLLALVWFWVTSMGGDLIRILATPEFYGGIIYIPWIAGGVFFNGMSYMANTELLIGKNMKPAAFWWTIGAGSNLLFNYLFIRVWGALAAAIINCACFALIFAGVMWKSSKQFKLKINWNKLLVIMIILLFVGTLSHKPWHSHPFTSIIFKMPICCIISLILVRMMVPGWTSKIRSIFGRSKE